MSVYSYAVMSNHTHIVLHVDPNEAHAWPDEEVARRWLAVFPGPLRDAQSEEQKEYIVLGLRSDPERMKEIRARLGSLSWFMAGAERADCPLGQRGRWMFGPVLGRSVQVPGAVGKKQAVVSVMALRRFSIRSGQP